nr:MAG TPA: hypothetical protein [Caudoviricetes sp.]
MFNNCTKLCFHIINTSFRYNYNAICRINKAN